MHHHILIVHLLATSCVVATISTSWTCLAGSEVTTFPSCNDFLNSGDSCATVLERSEKQGCLCNQDYLDSLYGCENELRLCFLNNYLDNIFDSAIISWDSLCGSYVTFSPTTQLGSAYTAFPDQLCDEVNKECLTAKNLLDECLSYVSDEDTSTFSSCTCQPRLLRLDYSCEYIGNASCLYTEAALSNLWGYSGCDNFASVIGTGLTVLSETTQSDLPDISVPTAEAGSTTVVPPAMTSTKDSTATQIISWTRNSCALIVFLIVVII